MPLEALPTIPEQLKNAAHDLRGDLATLLTLTRHIGTMATDETEPFKVAATKKLHRLVALADQLEEFAAQILKGT